MPKIQQFYSKPVIVIFILSALIILFIIARIFYQNKHILRDAFTQNVAADDETMAKPITRDNMDCYVINLEKNKDRMRNFQTSYNASDLASNQVIRIDAIYGKDIPHEKFIADTPEDTLGPGMVGCFLSHLKTYKTFGESDKPYALIFEDDAKVDPAIFEGTIQNLPSLIPANWDMILLGYYDHDPSHIYEDLGTCKKAFHFWGLHGYIVNKKSAQKLYSNMLPPFSNQIDHVMSRLSREGELNIYAVKKQAVWQNAKYTDVQIR